MMTEPAAMKAAIEQYMARHSAGDIDGIVELFADDASAWDPVGSEPHVGAEAIRAFFTGTHEMADRLTLTATGPIRCTANYAAFPMIATSEIGDMKLEIDIIDVMTFNDEGKFVEMRAYWDMADARTL